MRCLRTLCSVCGLQAVLPRSLHIPLCYDPTRVPERSGGFAHVWKGRHLEREVAAKALGVQLTSDLERTRRVGFFDLPHVPEN